ncbi:ABC transporter ATP-binding protein [Bradyrhizobium sp. KB893862 SZCCT0404]|uniref:ABC transporter ATP-binding protein n=1 Tax=Bradyrhizobium sp. KB893862 SZCCT0404 TaxID=2807672 RepID=UPI001BABC8AB|nr:ABC transporter ATP-binding protein [Bradyrhizobium sp. KB893862 SZCCT0404]MBR1175293.1 ABC transporter ATP-binding protein [Bradyrhizobium sp. KB893862 SZCCT0404]
MLKISHLSKSFGGVRAIEDVSFEIPTGGIYAVIGPNGAGKTTLFNLITGLYVPSTGSIALAGEEIAGVLPNRLAGRGMSRTFQNLQVCMNLSAIENVMVGAHLKLNSSLLAGMIRSPGLRRMDRSCRTKAAELLAFVGCEKFVAADASAMPYGALKRLEIARALAMEPKLLLLDEPAAGLNPTETHEIEELIAKLAKSGITVVLVEHDMRLVMSISERILVLDHGRRLAEGTPDEIRVNRDVIAAYLGGEVGET